MKSILYAATLALAACGPFNADTPPPIATGAGAVLDATIHTTPADVANGTKLDELVGIAATKAYTATSKLGTSLARSGLIDKAKFKAADQRGYDAVLAIRTAYDAGNADSYSDAINRAYAAVGAITALSN